MTRLEAKAAAVARDFSGSSYEHRLLTNAIEKLAREFALAAMQELVPNYSQRFFNRGDYTDDYTEAIREAERKL